MAAKSRWHLPVLIASMGIAMGLLSELMPDSLKQGLEEVSQNLTGLSYTWIWAALVLFVCCISHSPTRLGVYSDFWRACTLKIP